MRGSKLMGSQVKDSSGQTIGRIEDLIVNPTTGKIEFAIISRTSSSQGGSSSPSGSSSGSSSLDSTHSQNSGSGMGSQGAADTSTSSTYGSSSSGKLIPVPWSLLQPESTSSSMSTGLGQQQQSFTLSVDQSKLDRAPSVSRSTYSEISQPGWVQRVNSYYGVSESSGGAESPSGSSSGSSSEDSSKP